MLSSKGEKCGEIAKDNFVKITETARWELPRKAAYSEHSKLYSFNFNGGLINVTTASAFVRGKLEAPPRRVSVIFEIWLLVIWLHSFPFWPKKIFVFLDVLDYLCPNMINFYVVEFSERPSEEVIGSFRNGNADVRLCVSCANFGSWHSYELETLHTPRIYNGSRQK